jgi:hypothetical protein
MPFTGSVRAGAAVAALVIAAAAFPAGTAAGDQAAETKLTADLDGRVIALSDVGRWFCHDFDYPRIHCFTKPADLETGVVTALATTAVDYVTVYDLPNYAGSYMHVSEDYSVLSLLGWNDRISSFKGRNSQSGHLFLDWFYGGTAYAFCCNTNVGYLGSFDNTFSHG